MRNFDNFHLLYWIDFILTPIYIIFLIIYTKKIIERKYINTPIRQYILPALYVRIIGCIASTFMYEYYYGGGDVYSYFAGSLCLDDALIDNPSMGIDMFFSKWEDYTPIQKLYTDHYGGGGGWFFWADSSSIICKIGAITNLLAFRAYLPSALIITYFSFLGCWKLFLVFYDLYPHLKKEVAIATLFIPSVFFWGGAGMLKDTVVIASMGYFTYASYNLFIKRKNIFRSIMQLIINLYLMAVIKVYIVIAFVPALIVWVFLIYRSKITNRTLKALATPVLFAIGSVGAFFAIQKFSESSQRYSSSEILKYAITAQKYMAQRTEMADGSGYDLGELDDLSPIGIIKTVPKAINVTLFRPYLWETKKPILVPSVLESLFFFLFTVYIFYRVGIIMTFKYVFGDPNVVFCLIFALIFAFAVGFSTYNFGALARYKIPCMPFYVLALFIMYSKIKKPPTKVVQKVMSQQVAV
jgi:hypothetical protein